MRIENMNLIPNPSDPSKPVQKIIKKEMVVAEVPQAPQAEDSLNQQRQKPSEHVIDFLQKKRKQQLDKKKMALMIYKNMSHKWEADEFKGVTLNVKG